MGCHMVSRMTYGTLTANVVQSVTLDATYSSVEVVNRSYTGNISAFSDAGYDAAIGEALALRTKLHAPEREETPGPTP